MSPASQRQRTFSPAECDIAIVGGGMVGSTLALALGLEGFRVVVVEAREPGMEDGWTGFDIRVSAVTRASQRIFQALGTWQAMERRRVLAYREMFVWEDDDRTSVHFDSAEIGEPDLGHIIENRVILAALHEALSGLDTVSWRCPARVVTLDTGTQGASLWLEDGDEVRANLVVGADGARSRIRDLACINLDDESYGHDALVATVRTEGLHRDTAWQRFLPDGPLAFLPLPEGHSSVVWSAPPGRVKRLLVLSDEDFNRELTDAFQERLGAVVWSGARAAHPLRSRHAWQYVKPRLALVGDAAHTVHPLAGQGLNLGLLDAASLAQTLTDARGEDPGDYRILRGYERDRRGHNRLVQAAMGAFKHLFTNPFPPLVSARGVGLYLTDHAPRVKDLFMRQALGLSGDLPRLARPVGERGSCTGE